MATRPKGKPAKAAPARAGMESRRAEPKAMTKPVKAATKKAAAAAKTGNGHHGADTAAEQSAREVFETLTRWQGEVANAAEAMAGSIAQDAGEGTSRFASLLTSQRQMLEQIKLTLGQFQDLLETCEKQLEEQAKAAKEKAGEAKPMEMPLDALQSFQKLALSNIGVWTKIAQDAQGMWLGAMQIWVPKTGSAATAGNAKEEHD